MRPLKILQGNDVYLKLHVEVKINGAAPSEQTYNIVLSEVENLAVSLIPVYGRVITPEWAISDTIDNLLYVKIPYNLACGTYGIEITGVYNDRNVRAYYGEIVKIVHTDKESDTADGIYDGFDYYEPNDPFVVQFSGIVLPYLHLRPQNGHLYATNIPDGGNFKIENNHLIVVDNEGY